MPIPSSRPRQGALPLHLTLAMLPWLASLTALPLSKSGSQNWKMPEMYPNQPPAAAKLRAAWAQLLADPLLAEAAEKEARKRAAEFLEGLSQYQKTNFARDVEEPSTVYRRGSAKLLSYGEKPGAPSLLLIPSLINRYYILDLTQRLSFARFLSARGFNVFVVNWGEPSATERHFNTALYVTETLIPMAEWLREEKRESLIPVGYCMGGLLALALCQIRPDLVEAAAFLATPWDFSVPEFPRFALSPAQVKGMEEYIQSGDLLPAETIHTLFHCANPYAFQRKLRQFARMDKQHPATREFLAIEHWVNDGVPMTRGVAHDCLVGWTQENSTARAGWRVGGQAISPKRLHMPCFVAVPQDDRIVPASCALPLAAQLSRATLIEPNTGHVGMMVGSRRKAGLWEPFMEWAEKIL